jgi:hypothetical protein
VKGTLLGSRNQNSQRINDRANTPIFLTLHAAILVFLSVERLLGDPSLLDNFFGRHACFVLIEDVYDLHLTVSFFLHVVFLGLLPSQTNFSTSPVFGGRANCTA